MRSQTQSHVQSSLWYFSPGNILWDSTDPSSSLWGVFSLVQFLKDVVSVPRAVTWYSERVTGDKMFSGPRLFFPERSVKCESCCQIQTWSRKVSGSPETETLMVFQWSSDSPGVPSRCEIQRFTSSWIMWLSSVMVPIWPSLMKVKAVVLICSVRLQSLRVSEGSLVVWYTWGRTGSSFFRLHVCVAVSFILVFVLVLCCVVFVDNECVCVCGDHYLGEAVKVMCAHQLLQPRDQ